MASDSPRGCFKPATLHWESCRFAYCESDKRDILEETDVALVPGRISVITGASGCGKSTMLYLAAGIYPGNAGILRGGRVTLGGEDVASMPACRRARRLGMMFQNPDLQFCMDTVKNEIVFCLENIAAQPTEMDAIADRALAFCGIARLKDRALVTLSGGEKQKAALACIVALDPDWILLDEPFANIDPGSAAELAARLRELNRSRGTGIVAVDHHLDAWADIADETIVMGARGTMLERFSGKPAAVPEHERNRLSELGVSMPGCRHRQAAPAVAANRLNDKTSLREVAAEKAVVPGPISGIGATPGSRKDTTYNASRSSSRRSRSVALSLHGVRVTQGGETVLDGLDAEFESGRAYAVTGRSGCGKSTLFGTLCRLCPYERGSIRLYGDELKRLPRKKACRHMGFVFQNPQDQFVAGTVLAEISIGLKARLGERETLDEAHRILQDIGLWRHRLASPYMLSQGQQRRLAVAALLAHECSVLVCDEPTYAQDRASSIAVMSALHRHVAQNGGALVFSTHDIGLAREYADHILELRDGRLHETN